MAAKRLLDHDKYVMIKVLQEEGYSTTEIAVSKTLTRLQETGSVDDKKCSGRPKIATLRDDRSFKKGVGGCLRGGTYVALEQLEKA